MLNADDDDGRLAWCLKWDVKRDPLTKRKKRQPLRLAERVEAARALHEQFYTALATGDLYIINDTACSGLQNEAKAQIDKRKAFNGSALKFKILEYKGWDYPAWTYWFLHTILPFRAFRIVSDRIAPLPISDDSWVRQVVVRINSVQSLTSPVKEHTTLGGGIEYVVIQKLRVNNHEEDWKIWGTVEPSTREGINEILGKQAMKESMSEKLAALRTRLS